MRTLKLKHESKSKPSSVSIYIPSTPMYEQELCKNPFFFGEGKMISAIKLHTRTSTRRPRPKKMKKLKQNKKKSRLKKKEERVTERS